MTEKEMQSQNTETNGLVSLDVSPDAIPNPIPSKMYFL